jgi:NTE family protein
MQAGPIIGVDVTRGRSITARDIREPRSIRRWLLSGEWRNGPPIVSLLMRAATVTAGRDHALAQEAANLLILPKTDAIEIRDWKAYEPAVEEGYRATMEALERLDRPVTELTLGRG